MIGKLCFHEFNFVKCAGQVVIQKGCFKNFRTLNAAHDLLFTNYGSPVCSHLICIYLPKQAPIIFLMNLSETKFFKNTFDNNKFSIITFATILFSREWINCQLFSPQSRSCRYRKIKKCIKQWVVAVFYSL